MAGHSFHRSIRKARAKRAARTMHNPEKPFAEMSLGKVETVLQDKTLHGRPLSEAQRGALFARRREKRRAAGRSA